MTLEDPYVELKRLGNRLLVSRDYEGARKIFEDLVQARPDSADGYIGLAKTLERLNDYESIVEIVGPVVSRVQSTQLLGLLADAYRVLVFRGESEYVDAAISAYEAYNEERQGQKKLYYLAMLYRDRKKDYVRAAELLKEAWDQEPQSQTLYLVLLSCLRKLQRFDEIEQAKHLWQERNPPKANKR